jgi:hypothetical protein
MENKMSKELMDAEVWFNIIQCELEDRGLSPNMQNDGWVFAYENGMSPQTAIQFMDNA